MGKLTLADHFAETREILSYKLGTFLSTNFFHISDSTSCIHHSVKYRMPHKIKVGSNCEIRRGTLLDGRSTHEPSILIGDYCRIKENSAFLAYGGKIELSDNVLIGPGTRIFGHGNVFIGEQTMLGGGISIASADYDIHLLSEPFQKQGYVLKPITIAPNVWIGDNSCILGASIEENVVVGAGSVVTCDLESGFLYAGNPAKKIKKIKKEPSKKVVPRTWKSFCKEKNIK